MAWEDHIARAFAMDEAAWARHANPWSGWTRVATLPLLVLAAWSRVWIGPWWAATLFAALLLWTWINPRAFPPPAGRDAWMTRGVLGERHWLARDAVPVPAHHRRVPHLLSALAALGVPLLVWGVAMLQVWPTLLGLALAMLGKLWFVDRMVWLQRDMEGGPRP
jgi:hypothetical protein